VLALAITMAVVAIEKKERGSDGNDGDAARIGGQTDLESADASGPEVGLEYLDGDSGGIDGLAGGSGEGWVEPPGCGDPCPHKDGTSEGLRPYVVAQGLVVHLQLRVGLGIAERRIGEVSPTPTPEPASTGLVEPLDVPPTPKPVQPTAIPPTRPPAPVVATGTMAEAICAIPWPCQEALSVCQKESGCSWVWNTTGSGACGPFQTLPCVGWGDIDAHLAEAYRKWKACGGGSFDCAWRQFW
jgi:hypothetical protein